MSIDIDNREYIFSTSLLEEWCFYTTGHYSTSVFNNCLVIQVIRLLCMNFSAWKVSKCGVFSGLYFPVFGLNTKIYSVNLRIQSKYNKIRTRENSVFGYFSSSASIYIKNICRFKKFVSATLSYWSSASLKIRRYFKYVNVT